MTVARVRVSLTRPACRAQSVFDFVDVQRLEEAKPHTYHLVMQYPRRTFEEHSELSLGEVGLKARQEALFLEMK